MNVDEIAVILIVKNISPDMFVELIACKDFILVDQQIMKQIVFLSCDDNLLAVAEDFP